LAALNCKTFKRKENTHQTIIDAARGIAKAQSPKTVAELQLESPTVLGRLLFFWNRRNSEQIPGHSDPSEMALRRIRPKNKKKFADSCSAHWETKKMQNVCMAPLPLPLYLS
jgi:hypothetical protein